jgi:hypothetical protein
MLADLDRLLIAVFCTAEDPPPESAGNARRSVTDAELVTLTVAQQMPGIDHDAQSLALARRPLDHFVPQAVSTAGRRQAPPTTVGPDRAADHHLRGRPPRLATTRCCRTPRRCSAAAR